jgi:hypothetical protein
MAAETVPRFAHLPAELRSSHRKDKRFSALGLDIIITAKRCRDWKLTDISQWILALPGPRIVYVRDASGPVSTR